MPPENEGLLGKVGVFLQTRNLASEMETSYFSIPLA
jgi:hypothetical protein